MIGFFDVSFLAYKYLHQGEYSPKFSAESILFLRSVNYKEVAQDLNRIIIKYITNGFISDFQALKVSMPKEIN